MYTIGLTIIICMTLALMAAHRTSDRDAADYWLAGIMSTVPGAVFGFFIAAMIGDRIPEKQYVVGSVPLAAVTSTTGMSGKFIWGSGIIGQEEKYHFLYRNADGSLTPGHVPADENVHIIEDKTLKGVGYWSTIYNSLDNSSPLRRWALNTPKHHYLLSQELRVPAGTVVQNFNIQ